MGSRTRLALPILVIALSGVADRHLKQEEVP